nr:DEAD/DEAH box helicase family protein [Leptotrichiaceae bacterium]
MYYYEIYVENSKNIYTYKSKEKYHVGEWCIVNFVNSNKLGLIIDESEEENIKFDLSKIKYIIDRAPILSVPLSIIELIKWVKDYYLSDYYNVIRTVYPGILKLNYSKKAIYLKDLQEIERKNQNLFPSSKYEKSEIEKFNEYMKKKVEVTVATLNKNFSSDIIKKAEKEKSISIEKKLILKSGKNKKEILKGEILENNIVLNDEQKKAVDKIKKSENKFFLLKGITGSGKTEIYINLVKSALKENQGSIFLVPEISLTTQIIERFEKEFSDSIAILHSKLSDLEKKQEWAYIRSGDKKIVIGARSAIFAPVQNLKYIIIDEEHENTYKQDNNPRYHVK